MITRSLAPDTLEPGFLELFVDNYKETERVYPQIFDVRSSSKQDERVSAFSGFGYPVAKTEGAPIDYEDPVQMYDQTFTHVVYAKGFKVTREAIDDDQYNVISRLPALLGKSLRRWEEKSGSYVLERAFNSSYLGGDGQELCSTVHPSSAGGSSQSNASSTGITLTEANYETLRNQLRNQDDDKGMKIDTSPTHVIVPIELQKTAEIIFKSNLRSGTADNDFNPYQGTVTVIPWIYLGDTSTTAWFVLDKDQMNFLWFFRDRVEFKNDDTFDTEVKLYKARERFTNGFADWRGFVGSRGDGAAYSG